MAEKVGFALAGEYVHYANYAVAENLGDLTPAEWQAHAAFFERAFETLNRHGAYMAWRAAEAWAAAGEHSKAVALLHRAADSGALPPGWGGWLQESWAFQVLQVEPGWPELLARAQGAQPPEPEG